MCPWLLRPRLHDAFVKHLNGIEFAFISVSEFFNNLCRILMLFLADLPFVVDVESVEADHFAGVGVLTVPVVVSSHRSAAHSPRVSPEHALVVLVVGAL